MTTEELIALAVDSEHLGATSPAEVLDVRPHVALEVRERVDVHEVDHRASRIMKYHAYFMIVGCPDVVQVWRAVSGLRCG